MKAVLFACFFPIREEKHAPSGFVTKGNETAMVRIDIKPLKPGLHTFEWAYEAADLDLDPDVFSQIEIAVRLDVHPSRILASLEASATASLVCDRTLVLFDQDVEGTCEVLFVTPEFFDGQDGEDESIRVLPPDQEEIDLTTDARDTLMLALPQRRIAPGADALDIPMQYGAPSTTEEPAIDPRWEALRKLSRPDSDANGSDAEN